MYTEILHFREPPRVHPRMRADTRRSLLSMPKARRRETPSGLLALYRPVLDRTIFVLSLLGILVVVHLWLQQERGFDRGCFGFSTSQTVEDAFNCEVVTESDAGKFLGLSNVVWGLAFYVSVALTSAAAMALADRTAMLKRLRAGLIVLGFLYALYLIHVQFNVLGELCALCLTSAGVTAALMAVTAYDYFRPNPSTSP